MIDLDVHGDPAGCRSAAGCATSVASAIATAENDVRSVSSSASFWPGDAGDGFREALGSTGKDLGRLHDRVQAASRALENFAGELTVVKSDLAQACDVAAGAGLQIVGDRIQAPSQPPSGASESQVGAYNDLARGYNEAFDIARSARTKESRAHESLESAMRAVNDDGFVIDLLRKLGFAPPQGGSGIDDAGWALGLGGLGFGAGASWMISGRYGTFQPRVNGAFGSADGMPFWQRVKAASSDDNWHATPYKAAVRGRWSVAGKWVGRAGYAVTAITSGYDQWEADADNPALDTSERIGRAATESAVTTAGAWAGAEGGAWAGGAIGTAICPGVGTVVGGFVGSSAGGWVGHQLLDVGQQAGEAVGDFVTGAGHVAEDVVSHLNPFSW